MTEVIRVRGSGGAIFEVDHSEYIEKQLREGLLVELPAPEPEPKKAGGKKAAEFEEQPAVEPEPEEQPADAVSEEA